MVYRRSCQKCQQVSQRENVCQGEDRGARAARIKEVQDSMREMGKSDGWMLIRAVFVPRGEHLYFHAQVTYSISHASLSGHVVLAIAFRTVHHDSCLGP